MDCDDGTIESRSVAGGGGAGDQAQAGALRPGARGGDRGDGGTDPYVAESLERLGETADLVLYSDTPREWLEREWQGSELCGGFRLLLGEEEGTKRELVRWLVEQEGYAPRHVLVIGDSLVDYRAAKSAMALFFPILPGQEEASWYAFWTEGLERFLEDRFAGEFEEEWLAKFRSVLEQYPAPW